MGVTQFLLVLRVAVGVFYPSSGDQAETTVRAYLCLALVGRAPPECPSLVQNPLTPLGWLGSRVGRVPGALLAVFLPRVHPTARTPALSSTQPGKFSFLPREVSGNLSSTPSAVYFLYLHCPPSARIQWLCLQLVFPDAVQSGLQS